MPSLVWDHFKLKNDKFRCKRCKAMYKYNTTTTPMMYHLNHVHPTLDNVNALSSKPANRGLAWSLGLGCFYVMTLHIFC